MNLAIGLALWALSIAPTANFLMQGLEGGFSIPTNPSGDVIILLGGGIIDHVPDLTGPAAPSPLMMGRIVTAVRLYQRLKLPIIVSGGRGGDTAAITEASVDKRFLVDLGVPETAVIEEDQAMDTAQNARPPSAVNGGAKPIVITAAYHLKRAGLTFAATGLRVTLFPAYFLGSRLRPDTWRHVLPQAGGLYTCTTALHEYIGILYYRMV